MSPHDKPREQINTPIFCQTGRKHFLRDPSLEFTMLQMVLTSRKMLSVEFLRENNSLSSFPSACSVAFSQSQDYTLLAEGVLLCFYPVQDCGTQNCSSGIQR